MCFTSQSAAQLHFPQLNAICFSRTCSIWFSIEFILTAPFWYVKVWHYRHSPNVPFIAYGTKHPQCRNGSMENSQPCCLLPSESADHLMVFCPCTVYRAYVISEPRGGGVGGGGRRRQTLAVGRRERKRKRKKEWQDEGNVQNLITWTNVTIRKGWKKGGHDQVWKKRKKKSNISNEPDVN